MARKKTDSAEALGFGPFQSSETSRVMLSKRAKKDFDGFETKQKARLAAVCKRWCNGQSLTEEMMNVSEGRTARHKQMVQAFKAFAARLYGFERTVNRKRTFFVIDADPAKKQNKAGPILDRAKTRADAILGDIIAKEKE